MQPSSAPTLMRMVTANFTVLFPFESGLLDDVQLAALQNATAGFLDDDFNLSHGSLDDATVQVSSQTVVDVSNTTKTANATGVGRTLVASPSGLSLSQALVVNFTVTATYIGSDTDFQLHEAVDPSFQDPKSRWLAWLAAADPVFSSLGPEPASGGQGRPAAVQSDLGRKKGGSPTNGTVAIVVVAAVAALALGIAASVFSIRHYKRGGYGNELSSPRLTMSSSGLGSRIANENSEYHAQELEIESKADIDANEDANEDEALSTASSWMQPPPSPNSLENGSAVAFDQIMQNNPRRRTEPEEDRWGHIQPSNSRATVDPPSAESEINFAAERPAAYQQEKDPRATTSLFDTNVRAVSGTR